ncbi:F0F1 ATP synthase subunit gamma [Marimonas arenosa]|uniref:F0F1 ATP synthase subunit gamma n=1 Tax=Marimonas arenosa TaxID=1795305 RepID=A0AAE4B2D9_9RHOB|nr:FoF1 ATP synthase subunit gamma [Marimonas arenosa]MDQ2088938.1 F0F1 ATP synthase subunit gamma [Marimonas arenosa]
METVESLAARLDTTEEIGDIVRVMKTLASVSIRQFEKACDALEIYQRTVELGLQAVLPRSEQRGANPIGGADAKRVLIFVGSDRGLCGNFNEIIARFAKETYFSRTEKPNTVSRLLAVGQRGALSLATLGQDPDRLVDLPGTVGGLAGVARRVLLVLDDWRKNETGLVVDICHNRRLEGAKVIPCGQRLLPTTRDEIDALLAAPWPSRGLPFSRMPADELLPALLREQVYLRIYWAIAESLASEHGLRLAAMQAAERNINETLDALATRHRSKRQEAITSELLDIVAGYEAMPQQE